MKTALHLNAENLITKNGELYLFENFFDANNAEKYYHQLLNNIPWQKRSITMFGKTVDQPRLISWHADPDVHYSYSGIDLTPTPWTQTLLNIKEVIETTIRQEFNSAFLNLYRHGRDYMGWHRDNEKVLGPYPLIASVSLGARRKFKFKHMKNSDLNYDMELNSGSLLIMCGEIQHYWKHSLPKALRVNEPRINITFRQVSM